MAQRHTQSLTTTEPMVVIFPMPAAVNEAAAFPEEEEQNGIAGSKFLDEFMLWEAPPGKRKFFLSRPEIFVRVRILFLDRFRKTFYNRTSMQTEMQDHTGFISM